MFPRAPINIQAAAESLVAWAAGARHTQLSDRKAVLVLPDLLLTWAVPRLRECLASASAQVLVRNSAASFMLWRTGMVLSQITFQADGGIYFVLCLIRRAWTCPVRWRMCRRAGWTPLLRCRVVR